MEEQIEQALRTEAIGISAKLIQAILLALYTISKWALHHNSQLLHTIGKGIQTYVHHQLHEGKISEKTLQRDNGNIHQTAPISKQDLKTIKQSLNKSGVKYAVEKLPNKAAHDPNYIIHFRGEDLAHVEHAINRAADKLQHDINVLPNQPAPTHDDTALTKPSPQDTNQNHDRNTPHAHNISQKDVLNKLNKQTEILKNQAAQQRTMPTKQHRR